MIEPEDGFARCRRLLGERLREPAPARIQLLTGPRQVGKTTLLLCQRQPTLVTERFP